MGGGVGWLVALGVAPRGQRFEVPAVLLGERLRGIYRLLASEGIGCSPTTVSRTVTQRNRLRVSGRPRRFSEDMRVVARQARVIKDHARVLDSTPIYDAVAKQDTVTQLRAAVRKSAARVARQAGGGGPAGSCRAATTYASAGKPPCDWDDRDARDALVDALVRDASAALAALDGETLEPAAAEAASLLALVAGQDVEAGDDGVFRIARRVAPDRVISSTPPWIPRPATGIKAEAAASTVTRAMSASIPTPS